MEELLTPEMKAVIASLGELIKADPRHLAIQASIDEYERSEELNNLIAEYNMQQNALADAYGKDGEADETLRLAVQARIDALYDQITGHPVYVAYVDAKQAFDALTSEVYAELQFVITGQRPCSHNCATCHSDCGHQH
ncbi:MAG: YlbF family regulator [Clostridia bacterium]|nr:YlbF family regulator [Clostridia bacterium]MBQ9718351.1 YlbF family regulator [Clostridia bacterium]MBQ9994747.1 YlbF family regulator [Clostridia bacterium]